MQYISRHIVKYLKKESLWFCSFIPKSTTRSWILLSDLVKVSFSFQNLKKGGIYWGYLSVVIWINLHSDISYATTYQKRKDFGFFALRIKKKYQIFRGASPPGPSPQLSLKISLEPQRPRGDSWVGKYGKCVWWV